MAVQVKIDFSDPEVQANPYPIFEELRENDPVFWNGNAWLVSRYEDCVSLFTDPRMSSQRIDATFAVLPEDVQKELQPLREVLGDRMLLSDPPKHTRLRTLVMKAFSAKAAAGRRDRIQMFTDRFLDQVVDRGEMDVMADFATPLPGWTIADTLGIPQDRQQDFTRWARDQVLIYDRLGAGDRVTIMRQGQASMLEMKEYLEEVIDERRRNPKEDLLTELVQAEEAGDRLTMNEMVVMVVALLIGGNNSTAHLIGNSILTLIRHPDDMARLRAEPDLIRTAVEEVMRYESPVMTTSRIAMEDMELHGQQIKAGDNINLMIASANRDPRQFDDPDTYVINRRPNRHLTFAHGPHFCLGSALARNVSQIAVLTAIQRLDNLQLVSDEIEWARGFAFRHARTLPVTFDS
ncbi:MAG: cytochrome P450 [Thermomicrobiales bacterium]